LACTPSSVSIDLGAHRAQGLDVEVDRPPPDAVAADQWDEGLLVEVEQGTEQQDRDAVQPGVLHRDLRSDLVRRVDLDAVLGLLDAHTQ
jgi:hypothetical protein